MQVNLSAATGDMGILANHVPSIEPLRPGLVEVIESAGSSKKWFGETLFIFRFFVAPFLISTWFPVSGGFATVHPNNKLTINAIEAAPLEEFSLEVTCTTRHAHAKMNLIMITLQAVRANLQEAQKVLSGNGSEEDKAEARVEADVYESLQHALAK